MGYYLEFGEDNAQSKRVTSSGVYFSAPYGTKVAIAFLLAKRLYSSNPKVGSQYPRWLQSLNETPF